MDRASIIISASSDIGAALSHRWLAHGWKVFGTYRTGSEHVAELERQGAQLIRCDLADSTSIRNVCQELRKVCFQWDMLVLCPGGQDPVGPFLECSFDEWAASVEVNFTAQMQVIHGLLPSRRAGSEQGPCVLLFAGGGTNSATVNYSAYTVSKIALIKMCELLDAEIPDTRFVIVGPGWVKTKIHEATLQAGRRAGQNYQRTLDMLASDKCTPMEQVLDCCDWLAGAPRRIVSGRNFSVVFDQWGSKELEAKLTDEPDMYKLRRFGNAFLAKHER